MSEQAAMDELFGMMKIAKTQQEAVKTALDGLAAERAALAKDRAALAAALAQQTEAVKQAAGSVTNVAASIRQAASDSIPAIQKAAGEAVGASVRQTLAGASGEAATALSAAAKPVIGSLSGVVQAAGDAESSLKNAGQWFAWKWVAVAAGGVAGVCLVAYAALAWQLHQVSSLNDEKAALQAEVAELQANVAALEKRGGRIRLDRCGPDNRLCVEIASDQGSGGPVPYAGSWQSNDKQRQYVIPRGY